MANLLARGLREEGHAADVAGTGEDALWMARAVDYDAIVLDVMLPGIDGMETCRSLREAGVWSPVLMLTARDAYADRITGLDVGADDYVLKPFSFGELLARLRALVRRAPHERPAVLEAGRAAARPGTAPRVARRQGAPALGEGVPTARGVHAATGPGALAGTAPRRGLGYGVREPLQHRRRLCAVAPGADRSRRDRDRPRRRIPAADGHSVISRLPIRLRLMLPFALGMAVVLAATGFLIYHRVAATLLSSVDQSLRGQAAEATRHVERDRAILDRDAPGSASVGQLVAADGHVLETTPEGPATARLGWRASRCPRRRAEPRHQGDTRHRWRVARHRRTRPEP